MAYHRVPFAQAEPWLEHLTSCSPCYRDFSQFREAHLSRRNRILLAVAAIVILVASVSGWTLLHKRNENLLAQTAILDLRNRSVPRGADRNPDEQPLELSRGTSRLTILLPLGSSEGFYEVRITTLTGASLTASGRTARLKDGVTLLRVRLSLISLRPGTYLFETRRPGLEWESYPLVLR